MPTRPPMLGVGVNCPPDSSDVRWWRCSTRHFQQLCTMLVNKHCRCRKAACAVRPRLTDPWQVGCHQVTASVLHKDVSEQHATSGETSSGCTRALRSLADDELCLNQACRTRRCNVCGRSVAAVMLFASAHDLVKLSQRSQHLQYSEGSVSKAF